MIFLFFLQLSLDLHYTEDEIYELSLAREPRNSLSSVLDTVLNLCRLQGCLRLFLFIVWKIIWGKKNKGNIVLPCPPSLS